MIAAVSKFKAYAYLRRDPCSYCGAYPAGAVDHVTARARGGTDHPDNLTGSCDQCGMLKGCWPLLPFLLIRPWASTPTARMEP